MTARSCAHGVTAWGFWHRQPSCSRLALSSREPATPAIDFAEIRANRKVIPRSVPWYEVNAYPEEDIMPDFTMGTPIGPVSSHLSLNMRKHAVDMIDLGSRSIVPRRHVVRALIITVFLFVRESRNDSQTQSQCGN